MKALCSKSFILAFIASSLILSSCGKNNVVNNPGGASTSNPLLNANPTFSSSFNSIKSKMACLPGRYRLANDYTFYVNGGNGSQSTIYGQFQAGYLSAGSITSMYVGASAYGDLMFVQAVTNGSSLVGYNVTLSFCSVANSYQAYPDLVSNSRALVNFQTPYGITVNANTKCGYGFVAAAYYTYALSQAIPGNQMTADFPVYTTFSNNGSCF